ncbi:MAG: protein UsfY [Mycobacterium sp.]
MGDTHRGPTDHWHTTNSHTGETFIDAYCWPGLASIARGIISFAATLAAAAYQHPEWILTTGVVGALATAGGIAWLVVEHHRVLKLESQWRAAYPDGRPDRPISLAQLSGVPQRTLLGPAPGARPVNNNARLRLERRAL